MFYMGFEANGRNISPGAPRAPGRKCQEMQGFIRGLKQMDKKSPGALRAPGQECQEMQGFIRVYVEIDPDFPPARFARLVRNVEECRVL